MAKFPIARIAFFGFFRYGAVMGNRCNNYWSATTLFTDPKGPTWRGGKTSAEEYVEAENEPKGEPEGTYATIGIE